MKIDKLLLLLMSFLILLGSCATIVSQSEYPIELKTVQDVSSVVITDRTNNTVFFGDELPSSVILKAKKGPYLIKAKGNDNQLKEYMIYRNGDNWYFGNLVLGGVLGMLIVDPITGAMWSLEPNNVQIDFNSDYKYIIREKFKKKIGLSFHYGINEYWGDLRYDIGNDISIAMLFNTSKFLHFNSQIMSNIIKCTRIEPRFSISSFPHSFFYSNSKSNNYSFSLNFRADFTDPLFRLIDFRDPLMGLYISYGINSTLHAWSGEPFDFDSRFSISGLFGMGTYINLSRNLEMDINFSSTSTSFDELKNSNFNFKDYKQTENVLALQLIYWL